MSANLNELLKSKIINGWNLFWLMTVPISSLMVLAMMRLDLSSGEAVSSMIQLSVRCAVPWLYLAFAASSLHTLFPGLLSRWLLRNRKIVGLCFAATMAWQLLFILWMVGIYTQYYIENVYVLSDVVEGAVGYTFLIAMVLTSFKFGRSRLTPKQWKFLHTCGIYWLWAYAWSVYWFNLFYYEDPVAIDYVFYWSGFVAWSLRMCAWSKKRWQKTTQSNGISQSLFWVSGIVAVVIGLIGSSFGSAWSAQAYQLFSTVSVMESIDRFMPYFPFVPFYPIFIIMLGAILIVKFRTETA